MKNMFFTLLGHTFSHHRVIPNPGWHKMGKIHVFARFNIKSTPLIDPPKQRRHAWWRTFALLNNTWGQNDWQVPVAQPPPTNATQTLTDEAVHRLVVMSPWQPTTARLRAVPSSYGFISSWYIGRYSPSNNVLQVVRRIFSSDDLYCIY